MLNTYTHLSGVHDQTLTHCRFALGRHANARNNNAIIWTHHKIYDDIDNDNNYMFYVAIV